MKYGNIYMRMRTYEILFTSTLSIIYIWDLSCLRFKYFKRWLPFLLHLSLFVGSFKLITLWIEYAGQERKNLLISPCWGVGEAETPILIMFNISLTLEILIKDKLWEEIGWYVATTSWHRPGLRVETAEQSKTWCLVDSLNIHTPVTVGAVSWAIQVL